MIWIVVALGIYAVLTTVLLTRKGGAAGRQIRQLKDIMENVREYCGNIRKIKDDLLRDRENARKEGGANVKLRLAEESIKGLEKLTREQAEFIAVVESRFPYAVGIVRDERLPQMNTNGRTQMVTNEEQEGKREKGPKVYASDLAPSLFDLEEAARKANNNSGGEVEVGRIMFMGEQFKKGQIRRKR